MKTLNNVTWPLVVLVGVLAGYGINKSSRLNAQQVAGGNGPWRPVWDSPVSAPALARGFTSWPNQPTAATHWAIEDIRKVHPLLADAEKAGKKVDPNAALHDFPYWTRTHSMFIEHVPQKASGRTAQQHMGYAQFIVILGGEGMVVAGGQLQNPMTLTEGGRQLPGEIRGPSITGGQTFRLGEGDVVSIPANSPAQLTANTPGGMTYMVMKINAMLYPWEWIR